MRKLFNVLSLPISVILWSFLVRKIPNFSTLRAKILASKAPLQDFIKTPSIFKKKGTKD